MTWKLLSDFGISGRINVQLYSVHRWRQWEIPEAMLYRNTTLEDPAVNLGEGRCNALIDCTQPRS